MAKKQDKKVLELIEQIRLKKESIEKSERPNWKTNCILDIPEVGKINLHVSNDIGDLTAAYAHILCRYEYFQKAQTELGTNIAFKYDGYPIEDWHSDILARINKLKISTEKNQLAALEARLNNILSSEAKAKKELDAIMEEMK